MRSLLGERLLFGLDNIPQVLLQIKLPLCAGPHLQLRVWDAPDCSTIFGSSLLFLLLLHCGKSISHCCCCCSCWYSPWQVVLIITGIIPITLLHTVTQ
jgi:hypothetical protein